MKMNIFDLTLHYGLQKIISNSTNQLKLYSHSDERIFLCNSTQNMRQWYEKINEAIKDINITIYAQPFLEWNECGFPHEFGKVKYQSEMVQENNN